MNGYIYDNSWARFIRNNERKVKPSHIALMFAIKQIANEEGWRREFQLSSKEAMRLSCIRDRETFYQSLKDIATFGAITIIEDSSNQHSARWVSLEGLDFYLSEKPTSDHTSDTTTGHTADHTSDQHSDITSGHISDPSSDLLNNKLIETNKTHKLIKPDKGELNISFEAFYDAYGKKVDKVDSEKRWRKLTDRERELVMEDIPKYLATITDKKFQKSPATYLNKQSWTDERISNQHSVNSKYSNKNSWI